VKKDNNIHKPNKAPLQDDFEQLNNRLSIPYTQSREEIWQQLESQLETPAKPVRRLPAKQFYRFAVAAIIVLLLGSAALIRFHAISIHTLDKTRALKLPDGSVAYLNTHSELTYYPYWWPVSRSLKLTGEAYFQVKKGKKFSVSSKTGITSVMGTSFDIYARNNSYKVTCLSGKVKVKARKTHEQIILTPSSSAEVDASGKINFHAHIKARQSIAWKQKFAFTHTHLKEVIENLEKRYNVHIELVTDTSYFYSGTIPANIPLEEALNLICKPFRLTFVRKSNQIFQILQEQGE
jgi:transmembrane sensor